MAKEFNPGELPEIVKELLIKIDILEQRIKDLEDRKYEEVTNEPN